ncbi:MAG: SGNH/GDSL hydrolase family protein [Oscillospiraceae bacterium]|nr:SGNH/GDSL hydrolase family protein [Oscillospiraceae bacterium]
MKKNSIKLVSLFAVLSLLTGCNGTDVVTTTGTEAPTLEITTTAAETTDAEKTTTAETEAEIDYSSLSEEEIYDLMVERSLMTTGDMTRMANVFKRAADGEDIKAAYIGGSITEGYSDNITLKTEEKWVDMSTKWLNEQFPESDITYVNAGLSGTPSVLGNVRLQRDVLQYDPDIVFVEFAVNDGGETIYKNAYESLVRTLLTQDKDIAVVLLFTIVESGHTCQPHMSQIGENYGLPMISLPDSVWVEMQEGRMAWSDYSADQSHPNVEGSIMIRDFVINYFEKVLAAYETSTGEVDKNLPDPVFSGDYANMTFVDNTTLEVEATGFTPSDNGHHWFKEGWQFRADTGASLKFTVNCKKLAMVIKVNNAKTFGEAEIYVDGELSGKVNSNRSDGWNNPVAEYLIDNDECAEHVVEIVIPEGQKCYFGIMGFGYCE